MSLAMMIILGIVAISVIGVVGDTVSKVAQAKIRSRGGEAPTQPRELGALEDRIAGLEARLEERDDSVRKLQEEVRFVSRMLEDKSGGGSGR